jgi:epoxyqueuosine reductase QueG
MRLLTLLLNALICCVLLVCQGCSTVAPWERGNLARKEMSINPTPNLNKFRDHIFTSKEAAQGGHSGSGGGCGCN